MKEKINNILPKDEKFYRYKLLDELMPDDGDGHVVHISEWTTVDLRKKSSLWIRIEDGRTFDEIDG